MSGSSYRVSDQLNPYFLTCTVVHWIDFFSRKDYKDVIVDSLNYCVAEKYLHVYAWVIMSNHVHLVGKCDAPGAMSDFLRDFKKFTSKRFISLIEEVPESRREWLLDKFSFEARRTLRAEQFKIWQNDNHPIDLSNIDPMEKIDYIHMNPVRAGIVYSPEQYVYSSAIDYSGGKGLVKVTVI